MATTIDIEKAEQQILAILPTAKSLNNAEINTKGLFLVFQNIETQNAFIGAVGYQFTLYIAINSCVSNIRLAYAPLSEVLSALLADWQQQQCVEIGRIKPHATKGLWVYEIPLTVHGGQHVAMDE